MMTAAVTLPRSDKLSSMLSKILLHASTPRTSHFLAPYTSFRRELIVAEDGDGRVSGSISYCEGRFCRLVPFTIRALRLVSLGRTCRVVSSKIRVPGSPGWPAGNLLRASQPTEYL